MAEKDLANRARQVTIHWVKSVGTMIDERGAQLSQYAEGRSAFAFAGTFKRAKLTFSGLVQMSVLGIALIGAGLIIVCGSAIFRWTRRAEPAPSQDDAGPELFRINDDSAESVPARSRAPRSTTSLTKEKPSERRPL